MSVKASNEAAESSRRSVTSKPADAANKAVEYDCSVCSGDGKTLEAVAYCTVCLEFLCQDCFTAHKRVSVTKSHKFLEGRDLHKVAQSDTTTGQADQCEKDIEDEQETQTTEASVTAKVGVASTVEPFCDLRVASKARHNVRDKGDKEVCWITGCQYLPDGSLILCDFNNSKLKLLNQKHELQSSLRLSLSPFDVAVVSQEEVVVTLPDHDMLLFVSVKEGMKCGRQVDLEYDCCAVAAHNQHLYALCRTRVRATGFHTGGSCVLVLDLQGQRVATLDFESDELFEGPDYVTVDGQGRVYVSDMSARTVICLSADGDFVFTHRDRELREPRGLLVDSRQNIYVCDSSSNSIQVLSRDGRKLKTWLAAKAGLKQPRTLSYRSSDRTLVVGMTDNNELMTFRLK